MKASRNLAGIRRTFRLFILIAIFAQLSGCGQPIYNIFNVSSQREQEKLEKTLEVETSLTLFFGLVSIRNIGDTPVTVRRVTINGKYVAENLPTPLGGRGEKYEPKPIETGRQVVLWLSPEWPQPVKIDVETDKGTMTVRLKYN